MRSCGAREPRSSWRRPPARWRRCSRRGRRPVATKASPRARCGRQVSGALRGRRGRAVTALGERLASFAASQLEQLERQHAPGFVLPRMYGGHLVDADTQADLAYTLSLVHAVGSSASATCNSSMRFAPRSPVSTRAPTRSRPTGWRRRCCGSGRSTTPIRWWRASRPTAGSGWRRRATPPHGCRSSTASCRGTTRSCWPGASTTGAVWASRVDDAMLDRARRTGPRPLPRRRAGGVHRRLPRRRGPVRHLLGRRPPVRGAARGTAGRALARRGCVNVLRLVEQVAARNGAAITWGRSTGALSVCMTIELGAVAVGERSRRRSGPLAGTGHQRGRPARRVVRGRRHHRAPVPLTLRLPRSAPAAADDVRLSGQAGPGRARAGPRPGRRRGRRFPRPTLCVRFREGSEASVWAHRSRGLAFVLPLVGGVRTDYLPAPGEPGAVRGARRSRSRHRGAGGVAAMVASTSPRAFRRRSTTRRAGCGSSTRAFPPCRRPPLSAPTHPRHSAVAAARPTGWRGARSSSTRS